MAFGQWQMWKSKTRALCPWVTGLETLNVHCRYSPSKYDWWSPMLGATLGVVSTPQHKDSWWRCSQIHCHPQVVACKALPHSVVWESLQTKLLEERFSAPCQQDWSGKQAAYEECQDDLPKNKLGRIPFSPEATLWIYCALVYRSLLWYHPGLIRNRGSLKCKVRQYRILNCLSIPVAKVQLWLREATEQCNFYRKNGKYYRWKHLYRCLANAKEAQHKKRKSKILDIIQQEKDQSFWGWIN